MNRNFGVALSLTFVLLLGGCSSNAKDDVGQGLEAGTGDSGMTEGGLEAGTANLPDCPSEVASRSARQAILTPSPWISEEMGTFAAGTVTEIGSDPTILDNLSRPVPNWNMTLNNDDGGTRKIGIIGWSDPVVGVGDSVQVALALNYGDGTSYPHVQSGTVRSESGELLLWVAQSLTEGDDPPEAHTIPPEIHWARAAGICKTVDRCMARAKFNVTFTIGDSSATLGPNESAQVGQYEARTLNTEFPIPWDINPAGCEGGYWDSMMGVLKKPAP